MKEKNSIIVLSLEDQKAIEKIEVHIPKINGLVNFQKYLYKTKAKTPNYAFDFIFMDNDISDKDKAVIDYFENQIYLIKNINSVFLDESNIPFEDITKNSELKIQKIQSETSDFISKFINTKLSDFLIQINNYVIEDSEKTEKVVKFINNIDDPISRNELQTFYDNFSLFRKSNQKTKLKDAKKIKLIYAGGITVFISLITISLWVFLFLVN